MVGKMEIKDDIKLPPEFISTNSIPVSVATIKRERMEEILREAVEADRQKRSEPEYRISACYFPKVGEVELTWERQYDGAEAHLTFKATPDQGERLVSVIGPCVYYTATPQPNTSSVSSTIAYMCGYNDSKRSTTPDSPPPNCRRS